MPTPPVVVAEVVGRFEDRLAAVAPGVLASATDRAVVRWSTAGDGLAEAATMVDGDEHPGPLVWLVGPGALAWGPTVVGGDGPAWPVRPLLAAATADLGSGGPEAYRLVTAAVSGDGRRVAVALDRPRPRVVASRARERGGPAFRVAVVEPGASEPLEVVGGLERLPRVVSWGDGPLLLGLAGRVVVHGGEPLVVADGTAPRSLTVSPGGTIAAGAASGRIYLRSTEWTAHAGPVTALAWDGDDSALASGGADGRVRVWSPAGERGAEVDLGAEVEALAWLDGGDLVVKAGGPGGRLCRLRLAG